MKKAKKVYLWRHSPLRRKDSSMESERQNHDVEPRRRRFSARRLLLAAALTVILVVALAYVLTRNYSVPVVSTGRVVTFDFDTGSPVFLEGQNLPFNQTSDDVTAYFSSPSDNASASAFSIQSYETTFTKLSQFSGKYLYDNRLNSRDILEIRFNQELKTISLTFATVEYQTEQSGPTDIKLTAYVDSADTTPVGSASARGTVLTGLYPQGVLSFDSNGRPFNVVRIEMSSERSGEATNFFVDNIRVNLIQQE
jgi:hypothetical protein